MTELDPFELLNDLKILLEEMVNGDLESGQGGIDQHH
jgi:hypothetical protein